MGEITYVNGELKSTSEALISVQDRGLLYGDGLFETIRTYRKKPFQLEAHLDRLFWGARKIKMELKLSQAHLKQAILDTIEANDYPEAVVRLTVTRGIASERMKVSPDTKPTVIITCDKFKGYPRYYYESGADVITVTDTRGDLAMVKCLNFLPNALAKYEADRKGAFEAIFATRRGFVTEGAVSNIFVVLDGILITPPVGERVLPGITREIVLSLAKKDGLSTKEDAIMKEELPDAQEIFLTNSLIEIMPVTTLDGNMVGDGHPGPIAKKLHSDYKAQTLLS